MTTHTVILKDAAAKIGGIMSARIKEASERGVMAAAIRLQNHIVAEVIPNADPKPIDKGIYRAAWKTKKVSGGVMIFNDSPHAPIIEYGRRPGAPIGRKMVQALAEWAKRHGLTVDTVKVDKRGRESVVTRKARGDELMQIAFVIALAIKRRGLYGGKGLRILEKALKMAPQFLAEEVRRELARG